MNMVHGRLYIRVNGTPYPVADCTVDSDTGDVLVYLTRDEGKRTRTAHRCGVMPQEAMDQWLPILRKREAKESE
jgi:hypothetical protein